MRYIKLSSILVCQLVLVFSQQVLLAQEQKHDVLDQLTTNTQATIELDEVASTLVSSKSEDICVVSVFHRGDRLVYYTLNKERTEMKVVLLAFAPVRVETVLWRGGKQENQFAPLDLTWDSKGQTVFVKFGFYDTGYGIWAGFDTGSGEMVENRDAYDHLRQLPVEERDNGMWSPKPGLLGTSPPVWGKDGKKYANEFDAQKAGLDARSLIQTSLRPMGGSTGIATVFNPNGEHYLALSNHGSVPPKAYILQNEELIRVISLAGPLLEGLWFLRINDQLYLKKFIVQGEVSRSKKPTDPGQWTITYHIESVVLGDAQIKEVFMIPSGVLIHMQNDIQQIWLHLDTGKISTVSRNKVPATP